MTTTADICGMSEKLLDALLQQAAEVVHEPVSLAPTTEEDGEEASVVDDSLSDTFDSTCSRSVEELESFKRKVAEDDRLSQIYKLRHNFSERFDNRAYIHPHGTTNFDYKAIPERRKAGFEKFKNKVRQENYSYLGQHPEVGAMISLFVKKLLQAQPADPANYLAEFFSTRLASARDFQEVLDNEVKRISRYRQNKLKNLGRIKIKTSLDIQTEAGEPRETEAEVNFMKKLNIGALAQNFK